MRLTDLRCAHCQRQFKHGDTIWRRHAHGRKAKLKMLMFCSEACVHQNTDAVVKARLPSEPSTPIVPPFKVF